VAGVVRPPVHAQQGMALAAHFHFYPLQELLLCAGRGGSDGLRPANRKVPAATVESHCGKEADAGRADEGCNKTAMKPLDRFGLSLAFVTASVAVVFFTAAARAPGAAAPKIAVDEKAISKETRLATSFAPVVKKAAPSVVNIYSTKVVKESTRRFTPFFDDPFWRRFFGEDPDVDRRPSKRLEQSLGSGVIVSQDGYILSNNHVVQGADEIKVALAQGHKEEYVAKLVGSDPQSEIAVLKIDAQNLPAITLADSDKLEVGDRVIAIGNPFGIGQTVTMGIVSAIGRGGFGVADYEDFIQTDASINPGNSGGALVDAEGRLVGINTFIISRSGGNQGIGFAVPINMARRIMDRLVQEGKVTRGYLGAWLQPEITADLAREFKLPDPSGAMLSQIMDQSPAQDAGLKEGDVVIEFNGRKVTDSRNLRLMVSQTPPKTKVNLKILRDGKAKTLAVTLGELPEDKSLRPGRGGPADESGQDALDGVTVTDIDARTRRQLDMPDNLRGALVTEVEPDSPAYAAGLRPGGVILEINRQMVRDADDAVQLSKKVKGDRVLLRVWSQGGTRYLVVDAVKAKK